MSIKSFFVVIIIGLMFELIPRCWKEEKWKEKRRTWEMKRWRELDFSLTFHQIPLFAFSTIPLLPLRPPICLPLPPPILLYLPLYLITITSLLHHHHLLHKIITSVITTTPISSSLTPLPNLKHHYTTIIMARRSLERRPEVFKV